VPDVCNCVLC